MSYDETCTNKNAFHKTTTLINISEVDTNKIKLFDKTPYGNKGSFKYQIGYRHKNEVLLLALNIKLPQLTGYTKHFNNNNNINNNNNNNNNNNKYVNLLIIDKKNTMKYGIKLKGYTKENLIKKPLYNNKYIGANMMHTEFKYKKILQ